MASSFCIGCGKRNFLNQMHHISDIQWIREATLEILQLDPSLYLMGKPCLCLKHYLKDDWVLLESGRYRIRYGALPIKASIKI